MEKTATQEKSREAQTRSPTYRSQEATLCPGMSCRLHPARFVGGLSRLSFTGKWQFNGHEIHSTRLNALQVNICAEWVFLCWLQTVTDWTYFSQDLNIYVRIHEFLLGSKGRYGSCVGGR